MAGLKHRVGVKKPKSHDPRTVMPGTCEGVRLSKGEGLYGRHHQNCSTQTLSDMVMSSLSMVPAVSELGTVYLTILGNSNSQQTCVFYVVVGRLYYCRHFRYYIVTQKGPVRVRTLEPLILGMISESDSGCCSFSSPGTADDLPSNLKSLLSPPSDGRECIGPEVLGMRERW